MTAPPPRKFIFYIDEMALSQPASKKLKSELDRLFETTFRDGDEGMIVSPAQEQKLKLPFSSNRGDVRDALMKSIDREHWRATAPLFLEQRQLGIEMAGSGEGLGRRYAARRWANWMRNRVQQRLGHLRAIVTAAGDVSGRKVLVLVTESLPLEPGKEAFMARVDSVSERAFDGGSEDTAFGDWSLITDFRSVDWFNLAPLVEEIARNAATNGITIYAVQPEYGMGMLAPGGDIGATTPGREAWNDPRVHQTVRRASTPIPGTMGNYTMVDHRATNTEGTLRRLTETTGGTWHRGGLSFDDLVDHIASDVASYYSLGYHAAGSLDVGHRVEVRVKGRPELRVRARQEVIRKSPQREMNDRVVASLLTPPPKAEVPLRLDYETKPGEDRTTMLYVSARVPLSALSFVPDGDKLKAQFTVHYALTGRDADFISGVQGPQVVEVPAADFEQVKDKSWTYVVPLQLRKSKSKYTVAVGVLDGITNASGFGRVEVDVN